MVNNPLLDRSRFRDSLAHFSQYPVPSFVDLDRAPDMAHLVLPDLNPASTDPGLAQPRSPRPGGAPRRSAKPRNPGLGTDPAVRVDIVGDSLREKALLAWEAFMAE